MHQLVTVNQAADALALRPATIRKMITQQRLPVVRIGRAVRITMHDLEDIMKKGYGKKDPPDDSS